MSKVKVRFAPSPTGHLHIGGARTALFNYLYAKKMGGSFLVRIEDTDLERSSKESEEVIIRDLNWLGIHWDEGIEVGGEHGPYRSMERLDLYQPYVDQLMAEGKAYECYCSPEELEAEREALMAAGDLPRYMGRCRHLTSEQKQQYKAEGRKAVIRFRVPEDQTIVVEDQIRGRVEFDSNGIGDFVIVKSDKAPTYNFAVTIDDYLMKITDVIRGDEHLSNTPRQVLIYEALDFEKPNFAHVSLILGKDRKKMSKRHGSTWVEQYRAAGYLPAAIVNFLALLGWSPEGEEEFFSIEELEKLFTLDRVSKNPAIFDTDKLNFMNAKYIKEMSSKGLTDLAVPYLIEAGFIAEEDVKNKFEWLEKVVKTAQADLSYVAQITEHVGIFFKDIVELENEEAEEVIKLDHVKDLLTVFKTKVEEAEEITQDFAKTTFKAIQKETGIKGKNLFMPVRVALTGQCHGPDMGEILEVLGKEGIHARIDYTMNNIL